MLTMEERFFNKINKTNSCWLWIASTMKRGYGQFRVAGKMLYAHRVSYELANGPIPDGLFVLHNCHVRSCVNPAHLRAGTAQENMDDMINAGRQVRVRGIRHGLAKLTEQDVLEIRAIYETVSGITQQQLADKYSVDRSAISEIVNRKRWSHI